MKSKSKIEKQLQRKTNLKLVETIIACKKNNKWLKISEILSSSRKRRINLNLEKLNSLIGNEKIIVIPGKVLSQGDLDKKIKVVALDFSEKAREKIKKSGSEISPILEEVKKNPEAKGVKIIQ